MTEQMYVTIVQTPDSCKICHCHFSETC